MQAFKNAFSLLSKAEKKEVYWLLPSIIIRALLEVVTIAFLSPFLSLLTNPNALESSGFLASLYALFGFSSNQAFFIFMGVTALALVISSNAISMLVTWLVLRFSWLRDYSLSKRLLASYLAQPYLFFLGRNSADLGKNMLLEVQQGIRGVLIPGMHVIANTAVTLAILSLLIIMNPLLALIIAGLSALTYIIIYSSLKHHLDRIGQARVRESKERFQTVNEALASVKELKLLAKAPFFLARYDQTAKRYAHYMAQSEAIAFLPRYLLDTLAFGSLLGFLLFLLLTNRSLEAALPLLGLYAFAAYRLIPALQQLYRSLSNMRFNAAAIDAIKKDLDKDFSEDSYPTQDLHFKHSLSLKEVELTYPDMQLPSLQTLSLSIKKNSSVAFVGSTGSGKSTLVDILLGLLEPTKGQLYVDDLALSASTLRSWQNKLGYVPQSIYLTDSSIAENIAFGVAKEAIDSDALIKAAKIANVHDFVMGLEASYDTVVGERGVRLSGGQRQRIGIARALYNDPEVLLLDEATSALDSVTEEAVFTALANIMGKKTIIMIAHRLSTVKNCDEIFVLEEGRLKAHGNYQQLISSSAEFRALARVSA